MPRLGAAWHADADLAALPWRDAAASVLGPADGRGGAVRAATAVAVAWSPQALFVRFACGDQDRWATLDERDAPLWQEEVVELFLAPGEEDPRRYFELEINPLGALFDAEVASPDLDRTTMRVTTAWSCDGLRFRVGHGPAPDGRPLAAHRDVLAATAKVALAEDPAVAGSVTKGGRQDWWVALALPWSALAVPAASPPAHWRANFYRIERPRGGPVEHLAWSPTFAEPADFHRPRHFGHLVLAGGAG